MAEIPRAVEISENLRYYEILALGLIIFFSYLVGLLGYALQ